MSALRQRPSSSRRVIGMRIARLGPIRAIASFDVRIQWLSIFLSALASGLLSLMISHAYYRVTVKSAHAHHLAQLRATAKRHLQQMEQMRTHHAEQLLVLRTTLLAVEKDSGVEAARDMDGNLTGGVNHEGGFTAVPGISESAVAKNTTTHKVAAERSK